MTYLLEEDAKSFYEGTDREMDRSPIFLAIRNENEQILREIFANMDIEEEAS